MMCAKVALSLRERESGPSNRCGNSAYSEGFAPLSRSERATVEAIHQFKVDEAPGLAPGQMIVSFPHMTRPLLVEVDPAPAELRLVDWTGLATLDSAISRMDSGS